MSKLKIDLNCDLGELSIAIDRQIMPFISSCNIACGGHTGNIDTMEATVKLAKQFGVTIGAHPSYPDKLDFGRKSMSISLQDLKKSIEKQIVDLKNICNKNKIEIAYVKPHGALYNDMAKDADLAKLLIKTVKEIDGNLKFMGAAGTIVQEIAKQEQIGFISEVFADRCYENLGELRSRKYSDALLDTKEAVLKQVDNFLNNKLIDRLGRQHEVRVDSICLHSDTPQAVDWAKAIYEFCLR